MKRNLLIMIIAVAIGCVVLSSYEHGPAYEGGLNRTGSQGGAASCSGSGCHAPNNPATIVGVNVYDASGSAVTQYTPGQTYTVAITGHHTTSLSLTEFGFQLSAVKASSADQAGSFTVVAGSGLRVSALDGLQIVEHKKALDDSITNYFVARFSWTAPVAGAGDIQFYGILNPFGGEDDEDDDDGRRKGTGNIYEKMDDDDDDESDTTCPNKAPVLTLTEKDGAVNAVNTQRIDNTVLVYPNPCTTAVTIQLNDNKDEKSITLYAMNGAVLYTGMVSDRLTLQLYNIPAGIYQVAIGRGIVKTIIKQ